MKSLNRAIAAFGLLAAFLGLLGAALAQVPPAVPALPDTERRTSYSITGTTCACAVNFALYGDSTDYQDWVEVFLNGVRVTFNDPTKGWTITSPSGSLGSIALPITDAKLTFNSVQTGTVQIVGANRPRRLSQFSENRGVAARDLNVAITGLVAQNRETWDKINDVTGRALVSQPGVTLGPLPLPASCASAFLAFDTSGTNPTCVSQQAVALAPGSSVISPSTNGGVLFDNNGLLGDSKTLPSGLTIPNPTVAGTVTGLIAQVNSVNCVVSTAPANCSIVASAGSITAGPGGTPTTISSGTANGLLYNQGGNLGNLASGNNGVLVTGAGGAPSIQTTLPSALFVPSPTITGHATIEGVTLTGGTGTGKNVFDTSPTMSGVSLVGDTSATKINLLTITRPATGSTLTIANGKTLTVNNTMTLAAGADSQTFTLPAASDTVAGLGTIQSFTAAQTFSAKATFSAQINVKVREVTGNYTVNASGADYVICVRSASSVTVTLDPAPTVGDTYLVKDCTANSASFPITVSRNGLNIDSAAANDTISTNGGSVAYTYASAATGWMKN